MNKLSSKLGKSSQIQTINRPIQTIQVYSCQLYIDSFKISYRGFVYFIWLSETNQIQSLKYQSNGKLIQVKQTLTIGVRVISKNGKQLPLNTYLKLMNEQGEELDEFQLQTNNLTAQFKEIEVPMDRGVCVLKMRRRPMNIGQEEEISYRGLYRSRNSKFEEKRISAGNEYESLQEQLMRIKKQLEDEVYLNNKLKNDRDVLLATKQDLQLEIQKLLVQITKEISVLREHYENRITIREHCYQEELQSLINVVNSENDQNKKVVEVILKQKNRVQEEIKPLNQKNKKLELQINEKNQAIGHLQKQQIQKQSMIKEQQTSIDQLNFTVQSLGKQKEVQQNELNQLKSEIQALNFELEGNKRAFQDCGFKIKSLEGNLGEYELFIKTKDDTIKTLQNQISMAKLKEQSSSKQKQMFSKEISFVQEEKQRLMSQIQSLEGKLQQFQYQMQFNQNVMGQLKRQHQQKESQLYSQIENIEQIYAKKIQEMMNSFKNQNNQTSSQLWQKEKQELQGKIKQLSPIAESSENKMSVLTNQINNLQSQLKNNKDNLTAKDDLINLLQRELQNLKAELGRSEHKQTKSLQGKLQQSEMQQKNASLQEQLNKLKLQLQDKDKRINEIMNIQPLLSKSAKKTKNGKEIEQQGQDKRESQQQIYNLIGQKQDQINDLKRKVNQLENLYEHLQLRINLIVSKYPNVDLAKINEQLGQQERCDSEKQQEKQINANNQGTLDSAKEISGAKHKANHQHYLQQDRRLSIGNQLIEPLQKEHQIYRSEKHLDTQAKIRESINKQNHKSSQKASLPKLDLSKGTKGELMKKISINSFKDDHSLVSGTSYVRVSHSKKIKQMDDRIAYLQKKEISYLREIQSYQDQLSKFKNQVQSLQKKKNLIESENQLIVNPPSFRSPIIQPKKVSTESQVFFQDERIKNIIQQNQTKEIESQKKNLKIGELEQQVKELSKMKNQNERQLRNAQGKLAEQLKKEEENYKKIESLSELIKHLQKQMSELQQKLRKEKQNSQQARISIKQINIHYENALAQLKKVKSQNQLFQQKVKKLSGSEFVIRDLTKQVEELGKKSLQMTRVINHMKLQKDAHEQQLRMLKKRQNDQSRIASQWQEKAASLQRQIQQQKRKENKLKREIEEGQQQVRRAKIQQKKQDEELQALGAAQVGWQMQRRKHLDEISSLQDQLSRKDYEFTKLNKQIDKWKSRAQQKDDMRLGKKSQLKQQIQKLQNQLIRKEKKLFEQAEQSKLLRGRLQLLQRQNKRIIQQKNQTYGQKLKYYVQEMGNIKKLLDQYQTDNSRLKVQNSDLYQQYQILRNNYDKLQVKYDQVAEHEEDLLNDLQSYINQVKMLKDRLSAANQEIESIRYNFNNLKKEYDEEKSQSKKNIQKLQNSQRNLQRALTQLKEYKIKQSQYQTNSEINGKIGERYRALERKKIELEQEFKKLKSDYQNIVNTFVFKREDLEKAVNQARQKQKRSKAEQLQRMQEESNKTIFSKTQRLEEEILEVYNQNNRIRAQFQVILQQNGRQKGRISELQVLCQKMSSLQSQNDLNRTALQELKQQLRKKNEKSNKMQVNTQGLLSQLNIKQRQLNSIRNRLKQMQINIQRLNEEIKSRRNAQRQLQDALIRAADKKDREKSQEQLLSYQREAQMIQQYESRIRAFDIQLQKAKDKQARSIQENANKMKKLQQKMDQMEEALKQKEKAIETHYQGELKELQNSLLRLSQELQEKLMRNDQLNDAIILLQDQNKALLKEIESLRYQSEQEKSVFQSQLTKLKSKIKDSQVAYSNNLKSLQEELIKATQSKGNNASNSRVRTSEAQQRISKRYQQKLKNKDKKIEELKQNIYTLQQSILKFKKKETVYQSNITELEKLKIIITDFDKERKTLQFQFREESIKNAELIRQLRKEILQLKQSEQRARIISQQKTLQCQSAICELKTIKQLYQQLQRDLQNRKNNLTLKLEEESSLQSQLRLQQNKLIQLQQRLLEGGKKVKDLELQIKRKNNQLKRQSETVQQFKMAEKQMKAQISKLNAQIVSSKKNNHQMETSYQAAKNQLKQSKIQINRLRKSQQELKDLCSTKDSISFQLKKEHEEILMRYRESQEAAHKYSILNERSRQEIGCGIEQIIQKYSLFLQEREMEFNQMAEQIQELKFLNERKYLDYDQMKMINFKLQLKVQEYETLNEQLQTLRKICDKLEGQKKTAVFRQEVLRMQIQNLALSGTQDLKRRIQGILAIQVQPSFGNFSFY